MGSDTFQNFLQLRSSYPYDSKKCRDGESFMKRVIFTSVTGFQICTFAIALAATSTESQPFAKPGQLTNQLQSQTPALAQAKVGACQVTRGWNLCGGVPNKEYEGAVSQAGAEFTCADGTLYYFVQDRCAGQQGAAKELNRQLQREDVERITKVEKGVLLKFAKPFQFGTLEPRNEIRYAIVWAEAYEVRGLYGSTSEIVLNHSNGFLKSSTRYRMDKRVESDLIS
jgi:hypothetical protein